MRLDSAVTLLKKPSGLPLFHAIRPVETVCRVCDQEEKRSCVLTLKTSKRLFSFSFFDREILGSADLYSVRPADIHISSVLRYENFYKRILDHEFFRPSAGDFPSPRFLSSRFPVTPRQIEGRCCYLDSKRRQRCTDLQQSHRLQQFPQLRQPLQTLPTTVTTLGMLYGSMVSSIYTPEYSPIEN